MAAGVVDVGTQPKSAAVTYWNVLKCTLWGRCTAEFSVFVPHLSKREFMNRDGHEKIVKQKKERNAYIVLHS